MELTLLDIDQIFGDNKLDFIDDYLLYSVNYKNSGFNTSSTDFADLTAKYPEELTNDFYIELNSMGCERPKMYFPQSPFWTKSCKNNMVEFANLKRSADFNNSVDLNNIVFAHTLGIRPVIKYSSISNKIKSNKSNTFDVYEIEYGEYPNRYASDEINIELNNLYEIHSIKTTGKTYTAYLLNKDKQIIEKKYIEYIHNNKKYIKCDNKWLEVSPIKWLVDEKNDLAITKYSIVSGIPFDTKKDYDGNFKDTLMYKYLNTILIKEIKPSKKIIEDIDIVKLDKLKNEYIMAKEKYLCDKTSSNYKRYMKIKNEYYNVLIESAKQLRSDKKSKSLINTDKKI